MNAKGFSVWSAVVPETLFWSQIVLAIVFGGSQFLKLLVSTEGINASWLISWELFLICNLLLAVRNFRALRDRLSRQTVLIYSVWTLLIGADLSILLFEAPSWSTLDSWSAILSSVGIAFAFAYSRQRKVPLSSPPTLAIVAVSAKSIPQLALAVSLGLNGSGGLSANALLVGHITILLRLAQLSYSARQTGWNQDRLASFSSELANELSWLVVTIVWFAIR